MHTHMFCPFHLRTQKLQQNILQEGGRGREREGEGGRRGGRGREREGGEEGLELQKNIVG